MNMFFGIDTSCYTTSVAIVNENLDLVADMRLPLEVGEGRRGLRQSEGVFIHTRNLPQIMEKLAKEVDFAQIKAVGASVFPRRAKDSYMPVFVTGKSFGISVAAICKAPFYSFSHQEGHLEAAIHFSRAAVPPRFLALHISGGTTELLEVEKQEDEYMLKAVGESLDLHAGQLIDRVGVAMGLAFPCGAFLDKISSLAQKPIALPISVKGTNINFSGAEAKALQAIGKEKAEDIAAGLFTCIAGSLAKAIRAAMEQTGNKSIVCAGGVAANRIICKKLSEIQGLLCHMAPPRYATDNACGLALLSAKRYVAKG